MYKIYVVVEYDGLSERIVTASASNLLAQRFVDTKRKFNNLVIEFNKLWNALIKAYETINPKPKDEQNNWEEAAYLFCREKAKEQLGIDEKEFNELMSAGPPTGVDYRIVSNVGLMMEYPIPQIPVKVIPKDNSKPFDTNLLHIKVLDDCVVYYVSDHKSFTDKDVELQTRGGKTLTTEQLVKISEDFKDSI